jgi:hypothetical protein
MLRYCSRIIHAAPIHHAVFASHAFSDDVTTGAVARHVSHTLDSITLLPDPGFHDLPDFLLPDDTVRVDHLYTMHLATVGAAVTHPEKGNEQGNKRCHSRADCGADHAKAEKHHRECKEQPKEDAVPHDITVTFYPFRERFVIVVDVIDAVGIMPLAQVAPILQIRPLALFFHASFQRPYGSAIRAYDLVVVVNVRVYSDLFPAIPACDDNEGFFLKIHETASFCGFKSSQSCHIQFDYNK